MKCIELIHFAEQWIIVVFLVVTFLWFYFLCNMMTTCTNVQRSKQRRTLWFVIIVGETLQDERVNGGALIGIDGSQFPLKLIPVSYINPYPISFLS